LRLGTDAEDSARHNGKDEVFNPSHHPSLTKLTLSSDSVNAGMSFWAERHGTRATITIVDIRWTSRLNFFTLGISE
jgi:hypothetical protein